MLLFQQEAKKSDYKQGPKHDIVCFRYQFVCKKFGWRKSVTIAKQKKKKGGKESGRGEEGWREGEDKAKGK